MNKTLWRAFGALGIAASVVCAAPTALSSSKKTPTPSAEESTKTEKVNLNTASEKEIAAAKGVGDKLAAELVKNRPYKTWDDVSKVKGVGSGKKLESLKKVLKLSEGVAAGGAKEETTASEKGSKKKKSSSKGGETAASGGSGAAAGGAAAGGSSGAAGGSAGGGKTSASAEPSSPSKKSSSSTSSKAAASKLAPGEMININTASAEELDRLPDIGPVKAKAIVDYREANGRFATIEDIMKVSGIKEGTFAKIKDHITVK